MQNLYITSGGCNFFSCWMKTILQKNKQEGNQLRDGEETEWLESLKYWQSKIIFSQKTKLTKVIMVGRKWKDTKSSTIVSLARPSPIMQGLSKKAQYTVQGKHHWPQVLSVFLKFSCLGLPK